ncbi:hypothetical protein COCOBI_01-8430 [Coccomyxa sp. Obi]|nr:hypothetical protein COCOBI_01-8430 [Coccomyxa sp. Obi]
MLLIQRAGEQRGREQAEAREAAAAAVVPLTPATPLEKSGESESVESEGEETEQDEDQEEEKEDEMAASAQLPASPTHQHQEQADDHSSGHDVDIVDTTEEESGDELSGEQEDMERSSPGPKQLPNGRAAGNGSGPSSAPANRNGDRAARSDPSAVAAPGQVPGRQPSEQAAAMNGRGNACNTRSLTPDTETSEDAPLFLRVSGAYTPEAAAAALAADVAGDVVATSPNGRRQVAADTAWAAAAELSADVAGKPRHISADVAPPPAISSPLRKSPQKFKSVATLHTASVAQDARRLLRGGTSGNTGGGSSAAAVAQQPDQVTNSNSVPSRDQAAAASRGESGLIDMPLLQRLQSLHGSPDRLKSHASHSGQNISEATASRQIPCEADSAMGTTAAAAEGGLAMYAGGPTTAGPPGSPATVSGRPAATAGAPGGPAGNVGGPATAAAQGDPAAEARGVLATASGCPTTSGTQGGPSDVGDPLNISQEVSAAGWLVDGGGRAIQEASVEDMATARQQSGEAHTEMLDDSEQTMSEDEDDVDSGQSDNPMDEDYNGGGSVPSTIGEREGRELPRQPSYHWPTRGEMEIRRSGFSGANGAASTSQQRGVVLGLSAQARMRDLLKEVLDAMAKRVHQDKRRIFQEQVDQVHVPDYCNHVKADNEVWTSRIRQRVNSGQHASFTDMLRDFEQMAANARAYNTPGAGNHGSPYIIEWAEEILRVVREEGERRATQFAELEPLIADEEARGLRLEHVQRYVSPTIVLPEGFTVRVVKSQAKPRGYMEYVASCPIHGSGALTLSYEEREAWNEWGPQPDETRTDYELRVRETFHFRRKEVPPHLINTVTVPGMYGSQRTGVARPGSSRGDVPNAAAQRTWHAAADHPTRMALIERIEESVARMKAAYPNRFYPRVLDLEQVLYTTALSEDDYSCEADFDDRLQRAIGLARQRRHAQGCAQGATPRSPNTAERNFQETCNVILTAAAQDASDNGISHDDVTGSDHLMPSDAAAAPDADSARPAAAAAPGGPGGAAAAGPPYNGLRTVPPTSSHRAASTLPTQAVQSGGAAPPRVTSIPVFNCAHGAQPQPQQQLRTAAAGQVAGAVPSPPGPQSPRSSAMANHSQPLPQPEAAAASVQHPAHLPERQSSTRGDKDAATNVAEAGARASVVRRSQDALREQLHIGRPAVPNQASGLHPPVQRQPSLPSQASGQLAPAQRQPSMPAAQQQGSAQPVIASAGRQGSVGALGTAVLRQGSIGHAGWPLRAGSTTGALPGRPIPPDPGAMRTNNPPQAQIHPSVNQPLLTPQQKRQPKTMSPAGQVLSAQAGRQQVIAHLNETLKELWCWLEPRVTTELADRFLRLCFRHKDISTITERDSMSKQLYTLLGADLLKEYNDWQQSNKAAASSSHRSPQGGQGSSPRAAAHRHVPAHAVPNGLPAVSSVNTSEWHLSGGQGSSPRASAHRHVPAHAVPNSLPTVAPVNTRSVQQLAAGQTHYLGPRSSAIQSTPATTTSSQVLRPILSAPARVLPPPQPQLQYPQVPVPNDIATASAGLSVEPNKPVHIVQALVRTLQTSHDAQMDLLKPYLNQLLAFSAAASTAEADKARLQIENVRLKQQLLQSEEVVQQLSVKLREAAREKQALYDALMEVHGKNARLLEQLHGRTPPANLASGTGQQLPDQAPPPSQLPVPQPQLPEAEVAAFEAVPNQGRAPLGEDMIRHAIDAALSAANGVPYSWEEGTLHPRAEAEGTPGSVAAAQASEDVSPTAATNGLALSIKRERSIDVNGPGSKRSRGDIGTSAGDTRRAEETAAGLEIRLGRPDVPGVDGAFEVIDLC